MDKHASRIEIFNSTLALLQQGWYVAQDGTTVSLPATEEVMAPATMYSKPFPVLIDHKELIHTEIRVEDKDCVLAARSTDDIDAIFRVYGFYD